MFRERSYKKLDLHGYRVLEALEVLERVLSIYEPLKGTYDLDYRFLFLSIFLHSFARLFGEYLGILAEY